MLRGEIDYEVLIDRSLKDFRSVKALWPVGVRLVLWIFLELILLMLCLMICAGGDSFDGLSRLIRSPGALIKIGAFTLASIAAAFLALRSAIPAREPSRSELVILIGGLCAVFAVTVFQPFATLLPILHADFHWVRQMLGLVILPWMALFWAVERGVPLQPFKTGGLIGIASFCFGVAAQCAIRN